MNAVERDVRDEQALRHAVRRVRGRVRHELRGRLEQLRADRRPGGEEGLHAGQRGTVFGGQRVGGGDDVQDGGGGEEDDLRVGLAHGRGDRGGGEGARGGDVHVGRHRAGAERRTQQRERREARHEPGVVRHVEVGGEHVAQRGELPMRVGDALRGSGRAGGEEDRGRHRRARAASGVAASEPIARMSPRLCETPRARGRGLRKPRGRDAHARPAERARSGEPGRLADDEVRPGAADRAGQTADAEARVGDDDDGADPQARVDDR